MENLPSKEVAYEFKDLFDRANKDKPARKDIDALQKILNQHPDLWRLPGNFAQQNIHRLLEETQMTEAVRRLFHSSIDGMKADLGFSSSPVLEKMLIDSLMLAWLRLNIYEHTMTILERQGMSLEKASFWEKRVSLAQGRYLRICRTLALVRRMARNVPALQVNIAAQGGQQVNVAGAMATDDSIEET